MFGVGTGELLLIMVVALVVLGPDKLPTAARTAGRWMAEFRRISGGFQNEFRRAVDSAMDDTGYSDFKDFKLPDLPDLAPGSGGDRFGAIDTDVPAAPPALNEPTVNLDKPTVAEAAPPSAPPTGDVSFDGPPSSFN
jgi:sec-independent protein translocase protein TatB